MSEDLTLNKLLACNRIIRYCLAVSHLVASTQSSRYISQDAAASFTNRYNELRSNAMSDFDVLRYMDRVPEVGLLLNANKKEEMLQHLREALSLIAGRMTFMSDEFLRSMYCV